MGWGNYPRGVLNFQPTLQEFQPSQIKSSGSPLPTVTLQNVASGLFQMTFGPVLGTPGSGGLEISSVSTCAPGGSELAINGDDFKNTESVTFGGLGGLDASFLVDSNTEVTARVPFDANPGPIVISTPDGRATSPSSFTVGIPRGGACSPLGRNECCPGLTCRAFHCFITCAYACEF